MAVKSKKSKTAVKKTAAKIKAGPKARAKSSTVKERAENRMPGNTDISMETLMFEPNKQFEKFTQDAAVVSQEQMEAVVKSATIFSKGMENIMKTSMDLFQQSGRQAAQAAQEIMACKDINDLTKTQSKYVQENFEGFVANATKLSEMSAKVATDCFEPINSQINKAVKKTSSQKSAA